MLLYESNRKEASEMPPNIFDIYCSISHLLYEPYLNNMGVRMKLMILMRDKWHHYDGDQ